MENKKIITRCYYGLGDHEKAVNVSGKSAFLIHIWARNVETTQGGIQVMTPPSQFRGSGSRGPQDGLVMDVPAQSGISLGCIGGKKGETIQISNAFGARVSVFLTIESSKKISITTD